MGGQPLPGIARVVFLLGKPPRAATLFPDLFERLRRAGMAVEVLLPHDDPTFDPWVVADADLVVQRGLRPTLLALLEPVERHGVRFCNPIAASRLVQDRQELNRQLEAVGLPVPRAAVADDWPAARAIAAGADVVVKAIDGSRGRSAGVAFVRGGDWPSPPPFAGPLVVEELVANDGHDRKLYVAGGACRGLLKPWPRKAGEPVACVTPNAGLCSLAAAVGQAVGLEIYGVDVVMGVDGPLIVDVNLFPSFMSVPHAEALVGRHLEQLAGLSRRAPRDTSASVPPRQRSRRLSGAARRPTRRAAPSP